MGKLTVGDRGRFPWLLVTDRGRTNKDQKAKGEDKQSTEAVDPDLEVSQALFELSVVAVQLRELPG